MAHRYKVKTRPHINKDGSTSETKKDYVVFRRSRRGGSKEVGVESSLKRAEVFITEDRARLMHEHAVNHPNDVKGAK